MSDLHGASQLPDSLTPAERRVLDYVRLGTFDAEIAVREGVSVGEVRERVARILAKLGLNDRAELAEWQAPGADPELPGSTAHPPKLRRTWLVAAPLAAVGILAGVTLIVLNVGARDHAAAPAPGIEVTATRPLPTSTPDPTATPVLVDGMFAMPMKVGDETEIAPGSALIIATGCWGCDGPTASLQRVFRRADGSYRIDELFRAPQRAAGAQGFVDYIHSYAIAADGSEMVVSVCTRAYCDWLDYATPDSEVTLFRSTDGGAKWREYGRLPGTDHLRGFVPEGVLVGRSPVTQAVKGYEFYAYPSMIAYSPPKQLDWISPAIGPNGQLAWVAQGVVLNSSGLSALSYSLAPQSIPNVFWLDQHRFLVSVYATVSTLTVVDDGTTQRVFDLSQTDFQFRVASGKDIVLGNARSTGQQTPIPAQIQLTDGVVRLLKGPWGQPPFVGRNYVVAYTPDTALVVNTPGECLNVRSGPSDDAPALTCVAHRALVTDVSHGTEGRDGWLLVRTLTGVEGWAAARFLDR